LDLHGKLVFGEVEKVGFYGSPHGMYDFFPPFWTITMSDFLRFA
jgi:hypothetical protein